MTSDLPQDQFVCKSARKLEGNRESGGITKAVSTSESRLAGAPSGLGVPTEGTDGADLGNGTFRAMWMSGPRGVPYINPGVTPSLRPTCQVHVPFVFFCSPFHLNPRMEAVTMGNNGLCRLINVKPRWTSDGCDIMSGFQNKIKQKF